MKFDPFESRLCRDIRNRLGQAFIKAIRQKNPTILSSAADALKDPSLPGACTAYINHRQGCLNAVIQAMETLSFGRTGFYHTAALLWNRSLFFEVHEWLEDEWQAAAGEEKKCLQSLIMAATVYELRLYHRTRPAQKLAEKALILIKTTRHIFPKPFEPDILTRVLSDLESASPVF